MIRITTLPNGARIVTEVVESVYSAAIDLWIEVGSAYENTSNSGVSHFIEHMLFKGTTTRSAERLMEEIEDVGGMLSASTSREITKLYGHMLGDCLPVAVDIMLDMVQNPLFAQADLALERKVILDEIDMYDDDPGDVAQELVYQHLWQGSPQAMPITGDSLAVKAMSRETLLSYYKQFYRPERMIVSVAGNFDEEATIKSLSQKLMDFDASSAAPRLAPCSARLCQRPVNFVSSKTGKPKWHS
ncbi:MAG: insulinase family protein [Candidatus Obscuribacter sp.]|nr:insulinase family protein [Candidatus Obscuribacter sp.]